MMVKIVGFKVGEDKATCNYKIRIDDLNSTDDRASLGSWLARALEQSDFVSVRK